MVNTQLSKMPSTNLLKPFQNHARSVESPDTPSLELDFSDLFGPMQTHVPLPLISEESDNFVAPTGVNELIYDEPEVVYSRTHSFVGPTTSVNLQPKLSKLTLNDIEGPLEFEGEVNKDAPENINLENCIIQDDSNSEKTVGLDDFEFLKLVGQGAFGKVYQVRKVGTSDIFAMKVMRKDKVMEKNHAGYMKAERDILTTIDHPFIVKLRYSFQTKYRLYLVLDFINGGHLFFQLYRQGLFREDLARIYAAEIVSAVCHLHAHGVMHRDLKPENILLDAEGHAMLTDFGVAKQFDEKTRSNSLCGTMEYMAPEVIQGKGHDKAADWWSVGILLYEMMTGKPPFTGGNRQKIQQKILKDKLKLPNFLSSDAHSLIKGLLQKDASKRLGSGASGSDAIKGHKWFSSIRWKKLEDRAIQPGFLPYVSGQLCIANFDERWTKTPLLDSPASTPTSGENAFKGFSYVRPAAQFLHQWT